MASTPSAVTSIGAVDLECDLLVLGAGPGGYSAAFRAADLGLKTATYVDEAPDGFRQADRLTCCRWDNRQKATPPGYRRCG